MKNIILLVLSFGFSLGANADSNQAAIQLENGLYGQSARDSGFWCGTTIENNLRSEELISVFACGPNGVSYIPITYKRINDYEFQIAESLGKVDEQTLKWCPQKYDPKGYCGPDIIYDAQTGERLSQLGDDIDSVSKMTLVNSQTFYEQTHFQNSRNGVLVGEQDGRRILNIKQQ